MVSFPMHHVYADMIAEIDGPIFVDTCIFYPERFKAFSDEPFELLRAEEFSEYRSFFKYFLTHHDLRITPQVFKELFENKGASSTKEGHKIIQSQIGDFKDCLESRVFDIEEDTSGIACEYRFLAHQYFKNSRPSGLSSTDSELAKTVIYFNLAHPTPAYLLTIDCALRSSASRAWSRIKEELSGCLEDSRLENSFSPSLNVFHYLRIHQGSYLRAVHAAALAR